MSVPQRGPRAAELRVAAGTLALGTFDPTAVGGNRCVCGSRTPVFTPGPSPAPGPRGLPVCRHRHRHRHPDGRGGHPGAPGAELRNGTHRAGPHGERHSSTTPRAPGRRRILLRRRRNQRPHRGPDQSPESRVCPRPTKGYDCTLSLAQYAVYQGTGHTVPGNFPLTGPNPSGTERRSGRSSLPIRIPATTTWA